MHVGILALTFTILLIFKVKASVIVDTPLGAIEGVDKGNYMAFHSIPYALPPTGKLRFLPPVEVTPWQGTIDGTKLGPGIA